jgi:putative ABC transport system permease protein
VRARALFAAVTGRRRFGDAVAGEMRFLLEAFTGDLVRSDHSRDASRHDARIAFGSVHNMKDDGRQSPGLAAVDDLQRDLRHAARLLRKTPGFTAIAVATLGLCLGANLSIFAVVDAVVLRPLPFPSADRLVSIFNTYPRAGVQDDGCSLTNYYERRGRIAALAGLAIYREGTAIIGGTGSTTREPIARVSPDFFSTLGVGPSIGRAFTEDETTMRADDVVMITDDVWRGRFGADAAAIGRATLRIDGEARTVVGVLPRDFRFLSSGARLYLPLASRPEDRTSGRRHSGSAARMIARLRRGATLADAQSQIDAHNAAMEIDDPEAGAMADAGFRSMVVGLHAEQIAAIRPTLLLVQAGALFLLLIGAVNLVNLLLIRAGAHGRELAVRQALGAGRRHVVSAVLMETTILTVIGGLLGVGVGASGIRLTSLLGADRLPLGARLAFDAKLAGVALAAAMLAGFAIGVPVAWYHLRAFSATALRSESRGGTISRAVQRTRHGFVVAQIALAFVLLAGTGLLALSLDQAMAVSPGFRSENVMSGRVTLPPNQYPDGAALVSFTDRLSAVLDAQPGIGRAGLATNVPLSGNAVKSAALVNGRTRRPGESPHGHYSYSVTGDYFAAMGVSLREGRFLVADDSRRADRVCVVDEDFARRYWPQGGAIGHRLFEGSEPRPEAEAYTIVGVVSAVKQAALTEDDAQGAVYYPFGHRPDRTIFLVVRTRQRPESVAAALQRAVRAIDPELPLDDLRSMDARIAGSLAVRRSPTLLAGLFSALAILLTAIGTYGVLSYAVAQRRREIGVRIALGARSSQVRNQFLWLAVRLTAAGTLIGAIGAWATGRAMQSVLFHVPALHVATLAGTAGILCLVCVAACLVPSLRAARISPLEALTEQ